MRYNFDDLLLSDDKKYEAFHTNIQVGYNLKI
jgi:hypothetical protein